MAFLDIKCKYFSCIVSHNNIYIFVKGLLLIEVYFYIFRSKPTIERRPLNCQGYIFFTQLNDKIQEMFYASVVMMRYDK